jgi:EAL domain-containing protein (putative c-di-GMP-specific phosphodiesterase class I)
VRDSTLTARAEAGWRPASDGLDVVRNGRFGVQYEPIVEVATGHVHAYEALARFHRRDGVTVPPAVVFERLRRHPELLARTELAVKRLQLEHAPGRRLFVNVSAQTWSHAGFQLLDMLGAAPVQIVVEVVENVHQHAVHLNPCMLRELAAAGVPAALDDLGGPNVLVCAEELHLAQVLKFDRSVLRHLAEPTRRALVETMLAFASRTGKQTVAEGVETLADLDAVRALGFDLAQGDLFRDRFRRVLPH